MPNTIQTPMTQTQKGGTNIKKLNKKQLEQLEANNRYTKESLYGQFLQQLREHNTKVKRLKANKRYFQAHNITPTERQQAQLDKLQQEVQYVPTMYDSKEEYNKIRKLANYYRLGKQHHKNTYIKNTTALYLITRIEPAKTIQQLEHLIQQEENNKLIRHNQRITNNLEVTDQQLEHIIIKLKQLEEVKYVDIDIDYNNKTSIILAYNQLRAYKIAGIELQDRPPKDLEIISVGNQELLDKQTI